MATNFDAAQLEQARRAGPRSALTVSTREFLNRPDLVGSAFPASRYLVDALLDPVDWSKARIVVEYGPGTGPLTRAMLDRMPMDSRLVTIDVSPHFTRHLRRTIADPRLLAVTASAACAGTILARHQLGSADLIVTGIPFSTMSPAEGAQVLDASAQVLRKDGELLAYQMRTAVAPMLAQRFESVERGFVWRNIPLCHLYWARGPIKTDR